MLREDQGSFAVWKSAGFIPAFISVLVYSQLSDLKEDHHTYMESCSMTIPIFAVAVIEMGAGATVAVVPSVLSPMCMKAGDPLLAQWWKGGSTALGAQVEGKTLRPLCQKHVADRRARPGARSGYCWVLLVGCPKIRARFCGDMSCLAEVCGGVTLRSFCLSFPWFWPVTCCHFNMAVPPLDFTAEKQAENWSI